MLYPCVPAGGCWPPWHSISKVSPSLTSPLAARLVMEGGTSTSTRYCVSTGASTLHSTVHVYSPAQGPAVYGCSVSLPFWPKFRISAISLPQQMAWHGTCYRNQNRLCLARPAVSCLSSSDYPYQVITTAAAVWR